MVASQILVSLFTQMQLLGKFSPMCMESRETEIFLGSNARRPAQVVLFVGALVDDGHLPQTWVASRASRRYREVAIVLEFGIVQ